MKDDGVSRVKHLAVIMDGNGRWAEHRGQPRALGHRAGVDALRNLVKLCPVHGIEYLTVYAFSTENWKRPAAEVQALMALLGEYIDKELAVLVRQGVCIRVLGDISPLAGALRAKIEHAVATTAGLGALTLSIALNYGGRQELLRAAKTLARRALDGEDPDRWQEEDFADALYTRGLPEPDLLIRTGGDMRYSNFLLWQIAYTELWSTRAWWPDFGEQDLLDALAAFAGRQRRFGGV